MNKKQERVRKDMKKKKQSGKIYEDLGIKKDASKDLHHIKSVKDGGKNNTENIVYLDRRLHKLLHRFRYYCFLVALSWKKKAPSFKETVDTISDGLVDKAEEEYSKKPFIKAMIENAGNEK